ncbi:uncharacterized protein [Chelonus insularis]|uniref:uncharacterized protein n=1 Tax=Chelonus insularis TaxID=460826 RepID=UPI00158F03D4|nr:uncharacterized protein LOC118069708 [Chelonus insularis]
MTDWKSFWIRGGIISQVAWINDEIIAWCSGIYIVFFNIINCTENIFTSSSYDGACCIAGNPKVSVFAFAERCERPRILVYSYPQLTLISECLKGTEHAYLAVELTSSDYLVSLDSHPTYLLMIWNWKNGEQLFVIETPINDLQGQIIKVADCKMKSIAQLGKDSGKLVVWKIMSTSTITMSQQVISLPAKAIPVHVDWTIKSGVPELAIVDKHGHVYLLNKEGSEIKRIIFSQRCGVCLEHEMPIICWFQGGIILKTTFCQLRFYQKSDENVWKKTQYVKSNFKPYILFPHPFNKNQLFYWTTEGSLMEMELSDGTNALKTKEKFNYGGIYNFVDLVYPLGQHLVVIDYSLGLSIRDVMDGKEISKLNMEMEGQVSNLVSHPDYPIIAIITTSGELLLINVLPENFSPFFKCRLQNEKLDLLKFSQCGRHLIVAQKLSNICYCIISDRNSFSNIYQVETRIKIIDFVLFEEKGILHLCLLALSSPKALVGNYIVIFTLVLGEANFKKTCVKILPSFYQCIDCLAIDPVILVTTPYLSRQIHYFSIEVGTKISLINVKKTNNQLRSLKINTNRYCITVSGYDGLITVFDEEDSSKPTFTLSSHHRKDFGTSKAICIPSKGLLISLGKNGSIICLISEVNNRKNLTKGHYSDVDLNIFNDLLGECKIIPPSNGESKKNWVEWQKEEKLKKEVVEFREKRLNIKNDLEIIKNKIGKLLDDNENAPEGVKLPISIFDLARSAREQRIRITRETKKDLQLKLEFESSAMNKVSNWIKVKFWNSQKVLDQSLFSILSDTEVTNCSAAVQDPQEEQMTSWLEYYEKTKKSRISMSSEKSGHFLLVRNKYNPSCQDEKSVIESLMIDDKEYEDEEERKEEQQASSGTTTHKFVKPLSQYSQYQDYSFPEFIFMTKNIFADIEQLRSYFNEAFYQVHQMKHKTMTFIIEKNAKIRQIDSELTLMFNQSVPELFPDPQWHQREQPDSILEVLDHEIAQKTMSSSQQDFSDKKNVEVENMRLSMLSTDFREKALMEMMDGVLEMRWVDVIKKDINKPLCILTKKPEEYTAEDILDIKQYELEVRALMQEREKYKRILENDFEKVMKIVKEEINKFNSHLHDLLVKKMKVESAIQQLNLLRAREYIRVVCKMEMGRNMQEIEEKIRNREKSIENTNQLNYSLQRLLQDVKNQRKMLITKDKYISKKLIDELRSIGKSNIEILKKEFKKRPRVSLKSFTAGELIELGKCVIGCGNIEYLFDNLLKYLKYLNSYDIQPSDLPDSITSYYWDRFVEIRRSKIDIELNLRANLSQINEIEESINENKIKIRCYKEDVGSLDDQLIQVERDIVEFESNIEIQLVLKMEQIESSLKGQLGETENLIFITRADVEKINEKIIDAGVKKLKAMKKEMSYHKEILLKEWRHKFLRMKLEDYGNELHDVQKLVATKYIREYLAAEALGKKDYLTNQQIEKNLAAMRENLNKIYRNSAKMLENVEGKIQAIKKENNHLDQVISQMSLKIKEMELKRDLEGEEQKKTFFKKRFELAVKRSRLVRDIQKEYSEVLALQAEYQSLLIKRYPLKYSS